jgi:hypothetical protein
MFNGQGTGIFDDDYFHEIGYLGYERRCQDRNESTSKKLFVHEKHEQTRTLNQ